MFFISKKKFENEVRSRVEQEMWKKEENMCRAEEMREFYRKMERLEMRLEKIEAMHDVPTNMTTAPTRW